MVNQGRKTKKKVILEILQPQRVRTHTAGADPKPKLENLDWRGPGSVVPPRSCQLHGECMLNAGHGHFKSKERTSIITHAQSLSFLFVCWLWLTPSYVTEIQGGDVGTMETSCWSIAGFHCWEQSRGSLLTTASREIARGRFARPSGPPTAGKLDVKT